MGILTNLPRSVSLVEVGPRDGLQNERRIVPTAAKVAFVKALAEAGHRHIELSSMVRADLVPQLADAEKVLRQIDLDSGARYTILVPNARGLERALAAGARSIAVLSAASDTFARRNTGLSVEESLTTLATIVPRAIREGLAVRAYVSTAFLCPYEGLVPAPRVVSVVNRLRAMQISEVSLADTIGAANPVQVDRLLDLIEEEATCPSSSSSPLSGIALHMHDTHGRALANVVVGLQRGIREFDSSAGGLGGCPFAPGAAGNLDTCVLADMLHAMGIETGIDLEKHDRAVALLKRELEAAPAVKSDSKKQHEN